MAASTTVPGPAPAPAETVLVATDYGGRDLDWHAMDVWAGQTLGALADPAPQLTTVAVLPTRVTFPGMPVARWWQVEEGDVDLTALSPAPEDLGRILFTEFALNYGNDFFWLPLDLPVGSVTKVESLRVTTSFGDVVKVPTTAAADLAAPHCATTGRAPWAMFAPTVIDAGAEAGAADMLVLLPVGAAPLHGEPLEEILLSRDEMANVAWALEMTVPGPSGTPLDRHELWQRSRPDPEPPPGVPHRPSLAYELATTLPPYWLPLLNRSGPAGSNRSVLLGLEALTPPLGTLLHNGFALHEERLTRTGIRLLRHRRRTRATDGRVHTWTARRSGPGQGESTSGLRFDSLRGELRGRTVDDGEVRPWRPRSEWRAARRAGTCRPFPSSRTHAAQQASLGDCVRRHDLRNCGARQRNRHGGHSRHRNPVPAIPRSGTRHSPARVGHHLADGQRPGGKAIPTLCLPKILSAQVGVAIWFRRGPDELVARRRSARCSMMDGCAAATGLPGCDERVRVTAASSRERPG